MEGIDIQEVIWDEWNKQHIWERHQLTPEQVEEACSGDPAFMQVNRTYSNRYLVIAPLHNKRLLAIVLSPQGERKYYPVSARIASKKERREYQEWKAGSQQ